MTDIWIEIQIISNDYSKQRIITYLNVVVLTDIMVETNELICVKLGFCGSKYKTNRFKTIIEIRTLQYLYMQAIGGNPIKSGIIKDHNTISTCGQSP